MDYREQFKEWAKKNPNASKDEAREKYAELKFKTNDKPKQEQSTMQKWMKAYFPRTVQAAESGSKFPIVSGIADAASIPFRTVESTIAAYNPLRSDNVDVLDRMGQISTGEVGADIIRDPLNVFAGVGAATKAPMLAQQFAPKAMGALSGGGLAARALGKGVAGAAEQLPYSIAGQAMQMERGQGSAAQLGTEIGLGAAVPIGGAFAKRAYAGTPKAAAERAKESIAEIGKSVISRFSGTSQDLLDYYGSKGMKESVKKVFSSKAAPDADLEAIRNYTPNALEKVSEIVNYIDTGFKEKFIEKNANVKQALSEIGEIDMADVVNELLESKRKVLHPKDPLRKSNDIVPVGYKTGAESVDKQLEAYDKVIDEITGANTGDMSTLWSAADAYELRKMIDATVSWDATSGNSALTAKLKKIPIEARTLVSNKLKQAGAKTSYPADMEEFHNLIDVRDDFMSKVGGGDADKVANFVKTLGNTNKLENYKTAMQLQKILGKDLFEEARILKLSQELGKGLGVYNDTRSGYANTGAMLGGLTDNAIGAVSGALSSSPIIAAPLNAGIRASQEALWDYSPLMAKSIAPAVQNLNRQYTGE